MNNGQPLKYGIFCYVVETARLFLNKHFDNGGLEISGQELLLKILEDIEEVTFLNLEDRVKFFEELGKFDFDVEKEEDYTNVKPTTYNILGPKVKEPLPELPPEPKLIEAKPVEYNGEVRYIAPEEEPTPLIFTEVD